MDAREQRGMELAATRIIKKKRGAKDMRSKTEVAMVNETLCKILCHNLVVLIHEPHKLGIEPIFWSKSAA